MTKSVRQSGNTSIQLNSGNQPKKKFFLCQLYLNISIFGIPVKTDMEMFLFEMTL